MSVAVIHLHAAFRACVVGAHFNLYGLVFRAFEFQGNGEFVARFERFFKPISITW